MPLPPNQPGGGGPEFRRQMRILADFMNGFEFVRTAPREGMVLPGAATEGQGQDPLRALATATLPERNAELAVTLPAGRYDAT
jgi:hypothetical protein